MTFTREQLAKGIWDDDIDRFPLNTYHFELDGYKCNIKRNNYWSYCGYVELPETHPDCLKDFDESLEDNIEVHGGVTYINGNVFGFDCSHCYDISPGLITSYNILGIQNCRIDEGYHYWTFDEVKEEVVKMVKQFKARE